MKRFLMILPIFAILFTVLPLSAFAATSNFGVNALLYGKTSTKMGGQNSGVGNIYTRLTDGDDSTYDLIQETGYRDRYYPLPTENIDRFYVRYANDVSKGRTPATFTVKFIFSEGGTYPVITVPAPPADGSFVDFYADLPVAYQGKHLNYVTFAGSNSTTMGVILSEFDVQRYVGPDTSPPAIPQNLHATNIANGSVTLVWDPVNDANLTGYHVYRNGVKITSSPVTSSTFTVNGLVNNVNYVWKVTAIKNNGLESGYSDQITTLFDSISPAAPVGLTAVTGNVQGTVDLYWMSNKETNLKGYNVYENDVQKNTSIVTVTNYTVNGVESDKSYMFAVTAINQSGIESGKSVPVIYYFDTIPPNTPVGLAAHSGNQQITLTWSPNMEGDLDGYFVYDSQGNRLFQNPIKLNTFTVVGLEVDTSYSFSITAIDKSGNESSKTSLVTAKTKTQPNTTPPSKPMGLTLSNGDSSASLVWHANPEPDIQGYNIYLDGAHVAGPIRATNYVLGELTNGKTYHISISAVNVYDLESPQTASLSAMPSLKSIPNVSMGYDLKDVTVGVGNLFSSFWLILAFAIAITSTYFVSRRVKALFGG